MTNNRRKRKLTSRQASIISWVITAVNFICVFVNGIILKPTGDAAVWYLGLCCVLETIFIFFVFYFLIFNVYERKIKEIEKNIEDIIIENLSNTDFRQVYFFVITEKGSHIDMMMEILKKEECKFYAKLTDNQHIYLVVKDKYDEEVYNAEIENYTYFNHHFKLNK